VGETRLRAAAPAAAAEGVLVLRNGNVVSGRVARTADRYYVSRSSVQLQIPAEQVEMFCSTLEEAYEVRRRRRVGNSADARIALVSWCLRNDLAPQAREQIDAARTIDPRHPQLAMLEVRVKQAEQRAAKRASQDALASRDALANQDALDGVAGQQVVRPAAHPSATGLAPNPESHLPIPALKGRAEFVRRIQPLLLRNCTTGGCHALDSPHKLRLDRLALSGGGHAATIQRNLQEVLQHIDFEDPASSRLLRFARQQHGNSRTGSGMLNSRQFALLMGWTNEITQPAAAPHPSEEPFSAESHQLPPLAAETPLEHPPTKPPANLAHSSPSADSAGDPFDPEAFNRQFAPETPAASGSEQVR
jgi:hypothetical protein